MRPALNSWRLFWVLAAAATFADALQLPYTDFSTARGTESIVVYSAHCALPLFLLAFTASSLAVLWSGRPTRWLLANRRYIGLSFAYAMACHLTLVAYYLGRFGNHINFRAELADVVGLLFLLAMTLTSFRAVSRHLSARSWRRLHKSGAYAIWLLMLYIFQAGARGDRDLYHWAGIAVLLLAWALRVLAWRKARLRLAGEAAAAQA